MKIEYLHASKYGNGAMVAEEFGKQMAARGVTVEVHRIREARPKELPSAELAAGISIVPADAQITLICARHRLRRHAQLATPSHAARRAFS